LYRFPADYEAFSYGYQKNKEHCCHRYAAQRIEMPVGHRLMELAFEPKLNTAWDLQKNFQKIFSLLLRSARRM